MITEWSVAADAAVVCVLLREESIGVESRPLGSVRDEAHQFSLPLRSGGQNGRIAVLSSTSCPKGERQGWREFTCPARAEVGAFSQGEGKELKLDTNQMTRRSKIGTNRARG